MIDKTAKMLNVLSIEETKAALYKCCASHAWCDAMTAARPFKNGADLVEKAQHIWFSLNKEQWLEAFSGHAIIGKPKSLADKYKDTQKWAEDEGKGAHHLQQDTRAQLEHYNHLYLQKFGYIFIICATGKSAEEMLAALQKRCLNTAEDEIVESSQELCKINLIRLEKLAWEK